MGIEFESFVRAFKCNKESVLNFRIVTPRGTSTITQQVAKLFISKLDEKGCIGKQICSPENVNFDWRLPEKNARRGYSEVYLNHCVTSDYGMIDVKILPGIIW